MTVSNFNSFTGTLSESAAIEKNMQEKISKAFAELNAKLIKSDQEWAAQKLDTLKDFIEKARADHKPNGKFDSGYGRFGTGMAAIAHFGSKAMWNLLVGHGREGSLANMKKNTLSLIDKRDNQIVAALRKKNIDGIPDFELKHGGDGYEGSFKVGDHNVNIRTIVAGGYNIQRMHMRTLIKVR